MGLAKCECGGTWRRLNKNSGKQKGYAQYSCSNRQLGTKKCANLSGRSFDYNFIGAACEKIPMLLTVVDSKYEGIRMSLESQLNDVERRITKLLDLYEFGEEIQDEVGLRLQRAKVEKNKLKADLKNHELAAAPEGAFEFGDAITAYLPAFMDVYPDDGSEESTSAFRTRALFRVRLLQSVKLVVVASDRKSMKILLTNGVEFAHPIEDAEFTTYSDHTESELQDMIDERTSAKRKLLSLNQ